MRNGAGGHSIHTQPEPASSKQECMHNVENQYQMKAKPISAPLYLWSDKKQKASDIVKNKAVELTALKVMEIRRSCNPQRVLTNPPKPSTTIATTCAIFEPAWDAAKKKKTKWLTALYSLYLSLKLIPLSEQEIKDGEKMGFDRDIESLFAFHQKDWVMGQLLWDKETLASMLLPSYLKGVVMHRQISSMGLP